MTNDKKLFPSALIAAIVSLLHGVVNPMASLINYYCFSDPCPPKQKIPQHGGGIFFLTNGYAKG